MPFNSLFDNAPVNPGTVHDWTGTFPGHRIIPTAIAQGAEFLAALEPHPQFPQPMKMIAVLVVWRGGQRQFGQAFE